MKEGRTWQPRKPDQMPPAIVRCISRPVYWLGVVGWEPPRKGQAPLEVFRSNANVVRALRLSLICPTWWGGRPTSFKHSPRRRVPTRQPLPTSLDAENFCL